MDFRSYDLDAQYYDEMFHGDGTPREHFQPLHETLSRLSVEDVGSIQERVTRSFSNEGITFTVYGDEEAEERIIPIDCVPRILSAEEWRRLVAGPDAAPPGAEPVSGRHLQRSKHHRGRRDPRGGGEGLSPVPQ